MDIMVIGDTHGNVEWLSYLLRVARDLGITTAVQLGDFGIWPGVTGEIFLRQVQRQAERTGVTLYAMTGNHDDQEQIARFEEHRDADGFVTLGTNLRWIPRGHRWSWSGVAFGALGGAFSIDHRGRTNGVDWWAAREEVQPENVEQLGADPLDVLLMHDAPQGAQPPGRFEIPITDASQSNINRSLLRKAARTTRPRVLLHGHWHVRQSRELNIGGHGPPIRIEGLSSDQEHDGGSWGVLELPSLEFVDGHHVMPK